jgi:enediyne biosynthesis protein E4
VTVKSGDLVQFDEVRGGSSYLSENDLRLHFGFGSRSIIDSVEVRWPGGKKELVRDLAVDFIYTIVEGEGVKQKDPFAQGPTANLPGVKPDSAK